MVLLLAQIIVALAVFIKICIIYVAVIIIWFLTSSWGLVILKYMPCVLQTFIDILMDTINFGIPLVESIKINISLALYK